MTALGNGADGENTAQTSFSSGEGGSAITGAVSGGGGPSRWGVQGQFSTGPLTSRDIQVSSAREAIEGENSVSRSRSEVDSEVSSNRNRHSLLCAGDEHHNFIEGEEREDQRPELDISESPAAVRTQDAAVLTDVHTSELLPEVEICSLIEDQIPRYKLRTTPLASPVGATATGTFPGSSSASVPQDFLGGEKDTPGAVSGSTQDQVFEASGEGDLFGDIIHRRASPLTPLQLADLSADFLNQFFSFFMIGGERIAQMTKTYHDIEAVTKLLEEKEHDLELAARIGQALLQENVLLKSQNDELNVFCDQLNDRVKQLKHDNERKTEVLNMFYQEEADLEEELLLLHNRNSPQDHTGANGTANGSTSADGDQDQQALFDITSVEEGGSGSGGSVELVKLLERKLDLLERENGELRQSTEECLVKTDYFEAKEESLLKECVSQLSQANQEARLLKTELDARNTNLHKQQQEKTQLLGELVELQKKYNNLTVEYENVMSELETLHECTEDLAQELSQVKQDYEKCASMLQDTQSELSNYIRQNNLLLANAALSVGGGESMKSAAIILNHKSTPATALHDSCVDAHPTNTRSLRDTSPPQSLASELQRALNPVEVPPLQQSNSNAQARQAVREMVTSRIGKRHRRDKIPGSNTGPLSLSAAMATPTNQNKYYPFGATTPSPMRHHAVLSEDPVPQTNDRGGTSSRVGAERISTTHADMQNSIRRLGASRQNEVDYKMFRQSAKCMGGLNDRSDTSSRPDKEMFVEGWLNHSLGSPHGRSIERAGSSTTAVMSEHYSGRGGHKSERTKQHADDHLGDSDAANETTESVISDVTATSVGQARDRQPSPSYSNLGSSVSQVSPARAVLSGDRLRGPTRRSHRGRPEKLQIVKPLEGSETLGQWQKLASTDMTQALFDQRPGVVARGESGLSVVGSAANSSFDAASGVIPPSVGGGGFMNSTEVDFNDSQSVFSSLHDVEEDDDLQYSNRKDNSHRSQRLSLFSEQNDSAPSHFEDRNHSKSSETNGSLQHRAGKRSKNMVFNRGDAAAVRKKASSVVTPSKPTGGLAVLCSSCSSAVAAQSSHKTPAATTGANSHQITSASPIYTSPFYTFAATSPVQSSDPVPPRILQILGFAEGHDMASSSRVAAEDNVPIDYSPDDDVIASEGGTASTTAAVLSRLRSALMGSTAYSK